MISKKLLFLFSLMLPVTAALAQTGQIAGVVTDEETGEPLPGVNVIIDGSTRGASTDIDGNYTIENLSPGTYSLTASFIGFVDQRVTDVVVTAGEITTLNFALGQSTIGLDEVVVIGYGTQERRDLTGSISSVTGDQLAQIPTPSALEALQGKVSGMQITPASGEPGADAVVRIRGVGTLNNAAPLYVVDGMLTDDISFLNPSDIEAVDVLKDASATAIYGSRGANGVIIITTRQGVRNAGTIFGFDAYYGQQQVMNKIDLANAREYATLANELAANEGNPLPFENPDALGEGVDWQDQVFQTAPTQNYQLSAYGGTDRISYNFSANYTREEGILRDSDYERASFRANNDYNLSEAITFGHNLAFIYTTGASADAGLVTAAYHADPTLPPFTADGEFTDVSVRSSVGNPEARIFYTRNGRSGGRLLGNLFVDADFLNHFTFRSSFGIDYDRGRNRTFVPTYFVSPTQQAEQSALTVNTTENSSWLWENTLTYNQTFGQHEIETLVGITGQEFRSETLGGRRVNIVGENQALWYLNAGDAEGQSNENTAFDWSILSYLFRTNYNFLDRYLFTVTFRADGSSRFGEENRYGYFPSLAAGWRISDEPFLAGVDAISDLKLRASWGQIGNDKIGSYPGIPIASSNLNAVFGLEESLAFGASLIALANPSVQWEEVTQTDIGLELGLLDDRLQFVVDWYSRTTDGILVQVPIPNYVGVNTQPFVNAAKVRNRGFDFNVNWGGALSRFDYRVGLVASTIDNEVLELGGGREEIFAGGLGAFSPTTRTAVGLPIGAFYGYKVAGVFQNEQEIATLPGRGLEVPGDLRYADINGRDPQTGELTGQPDGQVNNDDRTYLGSPIPDFIYGINLDLAYGGLDFSVSFTGQTGNMVLNGKKTQRFGLDNFEASYLDRWTGEGTSNTEPRVTNAGHNYLPSERFLEDGSFFKLRNIALGYALPYALTNQIGMSRVRVYLNVANAFTITDYSGYTPEIAGNTVIATGIDTGVYPIARSITVGVTTSF